MLNSKSIFLRVVLASIALGGFFATSAPGQQPSPSPKPLPSPLPPPGRLLNHAPDFSSWTIAFTYTQDHKREGRHPNLAPIDPAAPRRVVTVKTGDVIHEKIEFVSGADFDKWQVGPAVYTKPHGQAYWGELDGGMVRTMNLKIDEASMPVPASGFRDLDWINAASYAGTAQLNQTAYLLFVAPGPTNMDFTIPGILALEDRVAYVDATTRLPAFVRIGDTTRAYSFLPPPSAMQTLPADLAKAVQEGKDRRAKIFPDPVKEY